MRHRANLECATAPQSGQTTKILLFERPLPQVLLRINRTVERLVWKWLCGCFNYDAKSDDRDDSSARVAEFGIVPFDA